MSKNILPFQIFYNFIKSGIDCFAFFTTRIGIYKIWIAVFIKIGSNGVFGVAIEIIRTIGQLKIIRPAYKSLVSKKEYIEREER